MTYKAKGLVLKEIPVGENDKAVILLLEEHGKLRVSCRGARKQNSRFLAGTQVFTFGEFEIYSGITKNNSAFFSLNHVDILNSFYGLRYDFHCLYAAQHLLGLADFYLEEGVGADGILSLLLKALACLALLYQFKTRYEDNENFIRFVYQTALMKFIQYCGYAPETRACTDCGRSLEAGTDKLYFTESGVVCDGCIGNFKNSQCFPVYQSTLLAIRTMLNTGFKKLVSAVGDMEQGDTIFYREAERMQRVLDFCIRYDMGWKQKQLSLF